MTDAAPLIRDDCPGCQQLLGLLGTAEDANTELGRQVAGLERLLKRSGMAEVALKQELDRQREEEPEADEIRAVLTHWKLRLGHTRAKTPLAGARANKVRARLRERFTVADLKLAIDGCAKLPYVGAGGRKAAGKPKERFDDLTLICRDESSVERFMSYAAEPVEVTLEGRGVEALLARLDGVKQAGQGQWVAKCPAHDDRHASLSVGQGEKGAVLHCHAGCEAAAVVAAAGIEVGALFDTEPTRQAPRSNSLGLLPDVDVLDQFEARAANPMLLDRLFELRRWTPEALTALRVGFDGERLILAIRDEQGDLVNVLRYAPGKLPKMIGLKGRQRGLWPAPEPLDGDVWLVEGEPDAISGWTLGLSTVAVPGANGWRPGWAARFEGRQVVVCMDCDKPGRQLAQRVHTDLTGAGVDARILDLEPERHDGYDLSDALLDGMTAEALTALASAVLTERVAA